MVYVESLNSDSLSPILTLFNDVDSLLSGETSAGSVQAL